MPANQAFLEAIAKAEPLSILADSLSSAPSVSIRINPAKASSIDELELISPCLKDRVPWCEWGYELSSRPRFTFDPAMHQGLYYVQDSSSMAIAAAIGKAASSLDGEKIRYLDLCAAPGGKATLALSALPADALVCANEFDYMRAEILTENISKWGAPNAIVTRGDTRKYEKLPGFFNIVSVDAPCSGEGMMRKDEKASEQWSMQLVRECASLQRDILANAWTALAPGGFLIYSTCTFNTYENEDNVRYLIDELDATAVEIEALAQAQGVKSGIGCDFPCYRFIPGHVRGEGQFIALLRKPYSSSASKRAKKAAGKGKKGTAAVSVPKNWIEGDWKFWLKDDEIFGARLDIADDIRLIADKADAIMPGLHIGSIKGRDIVPSQALALSAQLNPPAFTSVDVDYDHAIAYLQRQAPILPDCPKGMTLLTYRHHPLGFAKNLGNRANNLYPKEWRIISVMKN